LIHQKYFFTHNNFKQDHSYWSHDSFKTESNGYFAPENNRYSDQVIYFYLNLILFIKSFFFKFSKKKVFNDLGMGVLNNAWNGFNASLFAYGQTGSGKSYSVVGYGSNKGIVPLVCEEIFKRIDSNKGSGTQFEVCYIRLFDNIFKLNVFNKGYIFYAGNLF
jgi:kinesin family protein 1